jgi:hypothetical protein
VQQQLCMPHTAVFVFCRVVPKGLVRFGNEFGKLFKLFTIEKKKIKSLILLFSFLAGSAL